MAVRLYQFDPMAVSKHFVSHLLDNQYSGTHFYANNRNSYQPVAAIHQINRVGWLLCSPCSASKLQLGVFLCDKDTMLCPKLLRVIQRFG
jgi:hypothetical protein